MQKPKKLKNLDIPPEVMDVLTNCRNLKFATRLKELVDLAIKDEKNNIHEVSYDIPGKGKIAEAAVCRVKNGISVNYYDPYMRRRDPDCMYIGDDKPTDKKTFQNAFKRDFSSVRKETLEWLKGQELAAFTFTAGAMDIGIYGLAIIPDNAGFFGLSLALLQGIDDPELLDKKRSINCFLYVAPPMRHTLFDGKQVVVHNRTENSHEIFSYNLYPGPSAKKGVYGALLDFGERQNWITAHASVVQIVTLYDNRINLMHEGASGSGKSEMHEHLHRDYDGNILFGKNEVTGEKRFLVISRSCRLKPVADDMALCHPSIQKENKLTVFDAENAWFIRVDHIKNYGTDPDMESRTVHPQEDLVFLNIDAKPNSTALLWEHTLDAPEKPCPNPRFILPRNTIPGIVNKPVNVDIRSFGIRAPLTTRDTPNFGILGIFHVLPPALAWIWRLVSPRGHNNPSIVDTKGMQAEGIGSYWPFATGKRSSHANLLLEQIVATPQVNYVLCPNQHIGAWKVGFTPQWIMREYLAWRGGARFTPNELAASRYPLLGYSLNKLVVENQHFSLDLLKVEHQAEVGIEAYDKGAKILDDFFRMELERFLTPELSSLGRNIIQCFMDSGSLEDYSGLISDSSIFLED